MEPAGCPLAAGTLARLRRSPPEPLAVLAGPGALGPGSRKPGVGAPRQRLPRPARGRQSLALPGRRRRVRPEPCGVPGAACPHRRLSAPHRFVLWAAVLKRSGVGGEREVCG